MSFNLATILTETAMAAPEAPVSLASGTVMTYRELDGQSGRFAAGLREAGLLPGQVVALQLPNVPQFLTAYFGALKAGLVVLPLNPLLMAPELEYHLTDSSAALAQQDITGRDLSALRVAVSGGASLPEDIMRTFEGKYGIPVLEGYGLSETASSCSFNRPDDRRLLSIGKPLWGVTMRVGDAADEPLPPGREHVGEILVRGHNVMKGYLGRPEATASTLRGGWLHTGDLGYMDSDGFYFIVDRAKDLVIRGGYNVYPREIEEVLYAHPGIAEAAVIGKPDERLGEEVVAVVVRRDGGEVSAEEVIAYCRERLAAYKYPREVRFMTELPKGPSGKILKAALREEGAGRRAAPPAAAAVTSHDDRRSTVPPAATS